MAINMLRLFLIVTVVVGSNFPAPSNAASPDLAIETFVRGLDTPWALDFAPDGRIFISERPGRIRIVEQGQLRPEPWMTLEVAAVGEAGLLGLAVDPQFSQNRFLYVAYSYRIGAFSLRNRLVRLREDVKGKGILDKVLIDDVAGASNHDGGRVKFGPDGKLYWTVGDAQTTRYAQNVKSWNGKILRLNSDGTICRGQSISKFLCLFAGPSESPRLGLATGHRTTLCHRTWTERFPRLLPRRSKLYRAGQKLWLAGNPRR